MSTSNMHAPARCVNSTAGCECDCAVFCVVIISKKAEGEDLTTNVGRIEPLKNSGCSQCMQPGGKKPTLEEDNHQLESRMRENRTYGSEGGAAQANAPFLPL